MKRILRSGANKTYFGFRRRKLSGATFDQLILYRIERSSVWRHCLWQQKYRYLGKERLLSHSKYPEVSLSQARQKRDGAQAILADGRDPAVQKRLDQIEAETQARTTFLLVAEEFIQQAYTTQFRWQAALASGTEGTDCRGNP